MKIVHWSITILIPLGSCLKKLPQQYLLRCSCSHQSHFLPDFHHTFCLKSGIEWVWEALHKQSPEKTCVVGYWSNIKCMCNIFDGSGFKIRQVFSAFLLAERRFFEGKRYLLQLNLLSTLCQYIVEKKSVDNLWCSRMWVELLYIKFNSQKI